MGYESILGKRGYLFYNRDDRTNAYNFYQSCKDNEKLETWLEENEIDFAYTQF